MDKIIIHEAYFLCKIGITEEERRAEQELLIDVELFSDIKKASKTDDIKDTINYSDVYDSLKEIAGKKEFNLIEAIAEEIADKILNEFPVGKVFVRIKKPSALHKKNVKYAAVEITRDKSG